MVQQAEIRDYFDFEAGAVYAIIRHIFLTSDFMSDEFDRKYRDLSAFTVHFNEVLSRPGSFLLVALCDKRPIGYLLLEGRQESKLSHTAWLSMGLVEECRHKGIGSQLVATALERAHKEGLIEIIYLMVRADHTSAIRLYKKMQFDTLANLERDTRSGADYYDGVMMRKFVRQHQ